MWNTIKPIPDWKYQVPPDWVSLNQGIDYTAMAKKICHLQKCELAVWYLKAHWNFVTQVQSSMVHACPDATWYAFLKRSHWILLKEFLRNGRGKSGLGQGFKVNWWKLHGFDILRGGTLRVTAAVHRVTNYVKQYEKCDPAARRCRLRSGEAK